MRGTQKSSEHVQALQRAVREVAAARRAVETPEQRKERLWGNGETMRAHRARETNQKSPGESREIESAVERARASNLASMQRRRHFETTGDRRARRKASRVLIQ